MIRVFLDANILIDITYDSRPFSKESSAMFSHVVQNLDKFELYTSCDLLTTVYFVLRKQFDNKTILEKIKIMNQVITVIEFGNQEVDEAIYLMEKNEKFFDLEDTIQFVMARKVRCDYIVTNNKGFHSHEVPLLSSEKALELFS
ncbi:MAG: Ribonuclease [uncultured Sulfurovum sp.]|uniref:Ribonuclease n=1 Tax=uncultured Sulfurovum sp. TaxID=269237 RepID=A0A6S6UDB6_9BACT|nr:MAG: Ribonuclease [uncultured Sulfurovum sp.]